MTATMPTSCRTQRASHCGKRRGQRSKSPNASNAASPTSMARATTMIAAVDEGMLSSNPNSVEAIKVSRTRRQPSIAARPRGLVSDVTAADIMA